MYGHTDTKKRAKIDLSKVKMNEEGQLGHKYNLSLCAVTRCALMRCLLFYELEIKLFAYLIEPD